MDQVYDSSQTTAGTVGGADNSFVRFFKYFFATHLLRCRKMYRYDFPNNAFEDRTLRRRKHATCPPALPSSQRHKKGIKRNKSENNSGAMFDPHIFYNRVRQFISSSSSPCKPGNQNSRSLSSRDRTNQKCSVNNGQIGGVLGNLEDINVILQPADTVIDVIVNPDAHRAADLTTQGIKCVTSNDLRGILNTGEEFNEPLYYAMDGKTFNILADLAEEDQQLRNTKIHGVEIHVKGVSTSFRGGDTFMNLDELAYRPPDTQSFDSKVIVEGIMDIQNDSSQISLLRKHDNDSKESSPALEHVSGRGPIHVPYYKTSKHTYEENALFFKEILNSLLVDNCCVFARMNPEAKTRLVCLFQALDYYVGMCGDGANDCGALKAAHMGVSLAPYVMEEDEDDVKVPENKTSAKKFKFNFLSNCCRQRKSRKTGRSLGTAEGTASLAAPFTAIRSDISCVPGIIREGRASLTTSFGVFKNMACYSLNQFLACLSLYWFGTNFSDIQFAFSDFFPATILSVLMGYTKSYPSLPRIIHATNSDRNNGNDRYVTKRNSDGLAKITYHKNSDQRQPELETSHRLSNSEQMIRNRARFERYKPDTSLALARHIGSVLGHILINTAFLAFAVTYTARQPWCTRDVTPIRDHKNPYYPHLVAAVFFVTSFQYIAFTIIFSKGPPFRRNYFSNVPLVTITAIVITFCVYLALREPLTYPVISKFFRLTYPPPQATAFHLGTFGALKFTTLYLILAGANFLVSLTFESVILDGCLLAASKRRNLFLRKIKPPTHATLKTFTENFF